jgi:hypothetical protein
MDVALGKPGQSSSEEAAHGAGFLVIEQLAISQTGVVVYQRVEAFISDSEPLLVIAPGSSLTAVLSMAAAFRNTRQLLHVHVTQLPRLAHLIAANQSAGGSVKPIQAMELVATKHLVTG